MSSTSTFTLTVTDTYANSLEAKYAEQWREFLNYAVPFDIVSITDQTVATIRFYEIMTNQSSLVDLRQNDLNIRVLYDGNKNDY